MAVGPWGSGRNAERLALRWASGLSPRARLAEHLHREALLEQLEAVDAELRRLHAQRQDLVSSLRASRDRLWPRNGHLHARRPPAVDGAPLPPTVTAPTLLRGRALRATCIALLRTEGREMALPDLHAALHLRGFAIDSRAPVQALSDALAYEVEHRRAERVRRGVYRTTGREPRPCHRRHLLIDPFLRHAPEEWFDPRPTAAAQALLIPPSPPSPSATGPPGATDPPGPPGTAVSGRGGG